MKVKLKEICQIEKGKQIDTSKLNNDNSYKYINGGIKESGFYSEYNTEGETILVSEGGASCGYVNYISEKFWCGCHCYRLTNCVYYPKYIYYALKGNQDKIMALRTGAAMPNIKKTTFQDLEIKVNENIEHQQRIAIELDTIQSTIDNKQQQLKELDELVKSRFIEMFGNKNFPTQKWDSVFITKTGKLDSNAMVEGGRYPFFTCAKEIFSIDNYAFDQEALLLAGNNAAGKYDVKYYKGKFNAYQRTYVLSLKEDWSYRLFQFQLEDKLLYLKEQSKGINTKFLTLKILQELEFIIPPKELQLKFETFVQQIDKSKFVVKQQIKDLQELMDSKMQEYFGE